MADNAERMAALKRAYADIILNTAKESADRILASERRVLQLQRSLSLAKEESLAMLLRLKAIMEAKLNESEKANLSQVQKIQELEYQLSEAKVTIDCLRFEVRRLNSELELDHHDATPEKNNAQENRDNSDSRSHSLKGRKSTQNLFTKDETCGRPLKNLITSDSYAGNPDLACIILSNKEPELYRNGCTQRIRAFEQNSVSGKDLPAQIHDQESNTKGEVSVHENDKIEGSSTRNFSALEKVVRRRNKRQKKIIMWPTKCVNNHDIKHDGSLDSNHSKVEPSGQDGSADNMHRIDNVVPLKILKSCSPQVSGEAPAIDCSGHLNENRMMTRRSVSKLCNSSSDHADKNHILSNGGCCQESGSKEPFLVGTSEMVDNAPTDVDAKNSTLREQKMLMKPDHRLAEDPDNSVTKEDHEAINVPHSDYKDEQLRSSLPSAEAGSDKILKYTFQRKRKKGSLDSKIESTTSEENSMSRRKVEKDTALSETPKSSSLIGESSRDSRRIAQVARQLISLSERRWW